MKKIVIIGAGAMGSLFGAKLAPLADVWLISRWKTHIAQIQRHGLRLLKLDDTVETVSIQATTEPETLGQFADLALIYVKSPDTIRASHLALQLLKPFGLVLSMQNGLGNADLLGTVVGIDRVIQGVTYHGATLVEPGCVRHAGAGLTYLARLPHLGTRTEQIQALFGAAGFRTTLVDDLASLVWGKLVINVGINALAAILHIPNGGLQTSAFGRKLVAAAVNEAVQIARAKKITLPYNDPQARVQQVIQATETNHASMLADVLRGVPTEIEAINAVIVREGKQLEIDTPVNQTLVSLIKAIEETYHWRL